MRPTNAPDKTAFFVHLGSYGFPYKDGIIKQNKFDCLLNNKNVGPLKTNPTMLV